jgi:hypothetical protein
MEPVQALEMNSAAFVHGVSEVIVAKFRAIVFQILVRTSASALSWRTTLNVRATPDFMEKTVPWNQSVTQSTHAGTVVSVKKISWGTIVLVQKDFLESIVKLHH